MLARARAKAPGLRWEQADALALPYGDDAFDAATVGFGARNFGDLDRGLREMARVVAPGRARRDPGDHDAAEAAACRRSSRSGSIASCRCSGRFDEAYTYLPSSVKRFPGPQRAGRRCWPPPAAATSAGSSPRAGSSPSTTGRSPDGERRGGRRGRRGGRGARPGADATRSRTRLAAARAPRTGRSSASTRARRSPPAASGCGRCWCSSPPGPRRPARRRRCARRSRSSSCTRPRWSTTTCSMPPSLRRGRPTVVAAAGRAIATATGDLLFSRAFAELAGGGSAEPVRLLSDASSALVQGELLQREDAWNAADARASATCAAATSRPARLFQAACELGALAGGGDVDAAGRVRRADRARVPAARRRARRHRARRSGPASTAAPTCSTARSRCR